MNLILIMLAAIFILIQVFLKAINLLIHILISCHG
ncbi:hypothetical protein Syn6312_2234 [Synechococcus sp. PCC 6312]|nr:hypothetical protein Syn6312_2234 [Synechococcus sp. PCC 6312]